jgi:hypothetical protein
MPPAGPRRAPGRRKATAPKSAPPPVPDAPTGPVEASTRTELEAIAATAKPLGQIALALARVLDTGAGMATAAVAKELRATLNELHPKDEGSEGDDLRNLIDRLRAPVGDAP